jgi:L-alanine-DL-glutamate epimerase-like enolase superfamily enzyme
MRIESVESLVRDNIVVVRVRTDDGVVGIGQSAPYQAETTAHVLHAVVARFFLGRDPWDVEALVDGCLRETYKFPSSFILRALAGVDTACWDILGKSAGVPVYKLLGGQARPRVPVYASSMLRSTSPAQEADRLAALVQEHGFGGVKVRVGDAMGRDTDAAPGRTEALVPLMRQVLGPDVAISADANGGYSPGRAVQVGRLLEEHGYFHFEEPVPFGDVEQLARVTTALDIPVSGGEQDTLLPQFHRLLTTGAVDIIQPDIGYLGGVSRARKVAVLAEAVGLPCTPHCANDSLLQVFSLHLAAAAPACFQRQEWSIEDTPWTRHLYGPKPQVHDGQVALPTEPGWGVELHPELLRDATLTTSEVRG